MQTEIKPKRTSYKGTSFRSKLEAQWAVFFDTLGLEYQYEPEYDEVQNGVWYKPDFCLPSLNCHIEIKPKKPNERALLKAAGWADSHTDIYIFYELKPPSKNSESGWLMSWSNKQKIVLLSKEHWWTECLVCRRIAITEGGEPPYECMDKCYTTEQINYYYDWYSLSGKEMDDKVYPYSSRSPRLLQAYANAKQTTFK